MKADERIGRVLTAMVTPFTDEGGVDLGAARRLAGLLTREGWNDGLVINGTTGESTTTSDVEKAQLLEAVRDAVGDRPVVAGVGTADTAHSIALARDAERAGASALMVVTPYYLRPSQAGIVRHIQRIADATALPVMVYDIPKRSGVGLTDASVAELARHPLVVAMKDATGDVAHAAAAIREGALTYYSGDDDLNLPFLAVGAVGVVSVVGHLVGDQLSALVAAVDAGDLPAARRAQDRVSAVAASVFRQPGAVGVKAALGLQGIPVGDPRAPLEPATAEDRAHLADVLRGLPGAGPSASGGR